MATKRRMAPAAVEPGAPVVDQQNDAPLDKMQLLKFENDRVRAENTALRDRIEKLKGLLRFHTGKDFDFD